MLVSFDRIVSGKISRLIGIAVFLSLIFISRPAAAQRAQDPVYVFHTNLGNIRVQLFPDIAPLTVANFLNYLNAGSYNNSFIHRSVPGFVFQGGGYQLINNTITPITANAAITNEFHLSNLRGTMAMALNGTRFSTDPNSATDEWFFNEVDNGFLDSSGPFTVFGRVYDTNSLAVMDAIAAVPVPNPSPYYTTNGPLNQLPLINYTSGSPSPSQFVTISAITQLTGWTAAATALDALGQVRILWNHSPDGQISIWTVASDHTWTSHLYGPFAGWTAIGFAAAPNGHLRVLWLRNADNQMSLWDVDSSGNWTSAQYGPFAGWTPISISVGADNSARIIWKRTADDEVSLWNVDSNGNWTNNIYGPFTGWTVIGVSIGADGQPRIIWNRTADNQMSLWNVDNSGNWTSQQYGPFSGWIATGIAVGANNQPRILWTHTPDGQISIWNVDTLGNWTAIQYGPFSGWNPLSISVGANNLVHVIWNRPADNQMSLWDLDASGNFTANQYGPF